VAFYGDQPLYAKPTYTAPPEFVNWDDVDSFYENKLKLKDKNDN